MQLSKAWWCGCAVLCCRVHWHAVHIPQRQWRSLAGWLWEYVLCYGAHQQVVVGMQGQSPCSASAQWYSVAGWLGASNETLKRGIMFSASL
jgi:hypothetical protein